ncbi:hypothetical protein SAMN05660477_02588 [Soonwooa buanensis]|uniref:Uncharacterized protein n=1 Tax=Soonwooa buanensis TaxID=619805 RepID=A0A1T5G6B0_9FLAO|nr:hypothetical protein SAMN05660477_02588 [Soonwooa buanensis]
MYKLVFTDIFNCILKKTPKNHLQIQFKQFLSIFLRTLYIYQKKMYFCKNSKKVKWLNIS